MSSMREFDTIVFSHDPIRTFTVRDCRVTPTPSSQFVPNQLSLWLGPLSKFGGMATRRLSKLWLSLLKLRPFLRGCSGSLAAW